MSNSPTTVTVTDLPPRINLKATDNVSRAESSKRKHDYDVTTQHKKQDDAISANIKRNKKDKKYLLPSTNGQQTIPQLTQEQVARGFYDENHKIFESAVTVGGKRKTRKAKKSKKTRKSRKHKKSKKSKKR